MRDNGSSDKGPHHIDKDRLLVELELSSSTVLFGWLFANRSARLSDALNDGRDFIPFEQIDGEVVIISKTSISKIVEICNVTSILEESSPYRVLGVRRSQDMDEIRKRYHEMLSRCHPDKYESRDPSDKFLETLRAVTQSLIGHFNTVRNEKGRGVEAETETMPEPDLHTEAIRH